MSASGDDNFDDYDADELYGPSKSVAAPASKPDPAVKDPLTGKTDSKSYYYDEEEDDEDDEVKTEKKAEVDPGNAVTKGSTYDDDEDDEDDDGYGHGYGAMEKPSNSTASKSTENAAIKLLDEKKTEAKDVKDDEYDDEDYEDEDDFEDDEEEEEILKPKENPQKSETQKATNQSPEPYEESVESVHDEDDGFEEEEIEDEPVTPPQKKENTHKSSNFPSSTAQELAPGKSLVSESFSSPTGHQDSTDQAKPVAKPSSQLPAATKKPDVQPAKGNIPNSAVQSLPSLAPNSKPSESSTIVASKSKSGSSNNAPSKPKGNPYTNKPSIKSQPMPEIPRLPPRLKPHRPAAKVAPASSEAAVPAANGPHPPLEVPTNTDKPRSRAKVIGAPRKPPRPLSRASEKKGKILVKRGKSPSYVNFVEMENLLSEKEMMIEQLRGEIKTLESVKRRYEKDFVALSDPQESIQKKMNGFQYEIRSLKDRLKSVQERSAMSERTIQNQEEYIIQLKTHCRKLEAILKSRNLSMDLVETEERLRAELEEKDSVIKDMRRQLKTMQDARESDYKKFKGMVKTAEAEAAQTRKEMEKVVQQMTEKDNELKVNNVKLEKEMNKKKRQLLEAQKQLQSQLQAQNAQVIPPNVPHNATPPSEKADAKAYSTVTQGRGPSPTKKGLSQVSQSPIHRSPSPVKKAPSQSHTNEYVGHHEPSELPEEVMNANASPPKKVASKPPAAPRQASTTKVENPITSAQSASNSQSKAGMTSHPSISSLPMSSFAKGSKPEENTPKHMMTATESIGAKPLAKPESQSEKYATSQAPTQAQSMPKAVAPVSEEEPEIDDDVIYESQDDRQLLTPTKPPSVQESKLRGSLSHAINKSREIEANDQNMVSATRTEDLHPTKPNFSIGRPDSQGQAISPDIAPPLQTESPRVGTKGGDDDEKDYSDFESEPVEEDEAQENKQTNESNEPNEASGVATHDNHNGLVPSQSNYEDEYKQANSQNRTYSPEIADNRDFDEELSIPQQNGMAKDASQDSGGKTLEARAELIGNRSREVVDDDLPDIVNQQNKVTDEARWTKKSTPESDVGYVPSQSDAKRPIGGRFGAATETSTLAEAPPNQPLQARHRIASATSEISQISMGHTDNVRASKALSQIGADLPEENHVDIPPQDSILKPAFGRPKKKYF